MTVLGLLLFLLPTAVESSPEDRHIFEGTARPLRGRSNILNWTYVHIPKTAGASFLKDAKYLIPIGSSIHGNRERAWYTTPHMELKDSKYGLGVFFRHPGDHILSQYMMCKFDRYFKNRPHRGKFPGTNLHETYQGFSDWLRHFIQEGARLRATPGAGKTQIHAYDCYNPWNMQARYMTGGSKRLKITTSIGLLMRNKWSEYIREEHGCDVDHMEPNLQVASRNTNATTFVGIQNLYTESLCVFKYVASGHIGEEECSCGAAGPVPKQTHNSHHVPKHSYNDLGDDTLWLIWKLAKVDAKLYLLGLHKFKAKVEEVEAATNMTIMCPERWEAELARAEQFLRNTDLSPPRLLI